MLIHASMAVVVVCAAGNLTALPVAGRPRVRRAAGAILLAGIGGSCVVCGMFWWQALTSPTDPSAPAVRVERHEKAARLGAGLG